MVELLSIFLGLVLVEVLVEREGASSKGEVARGRGVVRWWY